MANISINKRHIYIFYFCQDTTCGHESNSHRERDKAKTVDEIADFPNISDKALNNNNNNNNT